MDARLELTVYADHYQFYLEDEQFDGDYSVLWGGLALERHLDTLPGMLAVGTRVYDDVLVSIAVLEEEPWDDLDHWDHVVQASIDIPSGRLLVGECLWAATPETPHLAVSPGSYRARIAWAGLATAMEETQAERYEIVLWRGEPLEPAVLKWWPDWEPDRIQPWTTEAGGRLLIGAEAWDGKDLMRMVGSRTQGGTFLYQDTQGTYWEYGYVDGASYLEELTPAIALARFGAV